MNKNIAIVNVYFGEISESAKLSLISLVNNKFIDVFLFTNDKSMVNFNSYENLHVKFFDKKSLSKRVMNKLNVKQDFISYYKVCDYKPLYYFIFDDYIGGYEYTGYCDLDVIYGDISSFINKEKSHDVIGGNGHLTLIRPKIHVDIYNIMFNGNLKNIFLKILSSNKCYALDEFKFLHVLFRFLEIKKGLSWDKLISQSCVDFNIYSPYLYCVNRGVKVNSIYYSNEQCFINEIEEVPYVHFQKRSMPCIDRCDNNLYIHRSKFSLKEQLYYSTKVFISRFKSKIYLESNFRKKIYSYLLVRALR